jgi:glycosyltransferase 2 family protein
VKRVRFWVGIVVSLLCLALAFKDINLSHIVEALSQINFLWLLPAFGLTLLGQLGRAARWGVLFYPRHDLRFGKLFAILNIGYLISNIFPARLGDFARAYLISESEHIPVARSLSTIVVERTFDVLAVVFFLLVLLPFVPLPEWVTRSGLVLGVISAALLIGLIWLSLQRDRSLHWLQRILGRFPFLDVGKWTQQAESLIDGFDLLHTRRPLIEVTGWTLGIWLTAAVTYFILMQAFSLQLSFAAAVLVLCALGLSAIVPSSPGYIGVFHAVTVLTLSLFGIEKSLALSYAIVLHGLNYITLVGLGVFYTLQESISISRLDRLSVEMIEH